MGFTSKIRSNIFLLQKLGVGGFIQFRRLHYFPGFRPDSLVRIHPRTSLHPVYCRPGSSDGWILNQIFLLENYSCLSDIEASGLILDLGGNVGHSAAYLLSRFPTAELISVEPDKENFALLQRTVAPFGSRARAICSGVWSEPCGLVMDEEAYEDASRECSRRVRVAKEGEIPLLQAVNVASLLESSGHERILLLKVDIEGSEREVFGPSSAAWIDRVDNIVIELHGPQCEQVFFEAIAGQDFAISTYRELTVCKRRSPGSDHERVEERQRGTAKGSF